MKTSVRVSILLAFAALTAACAHNREVPTLQEQLAERGYTQGDTVRDIQNYRLNGWNYLDSRHLIIDTGPSESYLVTLRVDCHPLSTSQDIGFTSTAGQLTSFDSVVLTDSAGLRRDCPIDEIQELEEVPEDESASDA